MAVFWNLMFFLDCRYISILMVKHPAIFIYGLKTESNWARQSLIEINSFNYEEGGRFFLGTDAICL